MVVWDLMIVGQLMKSSPGFVYREALDRSVTFVYTSLHIGKELVIVLVIMMTMANVQTDSTCASARFSLLSRKIFTTTCSTTQKDYS